MTQPEREMDNLLERYSRACPEVEPGAAFMPGIWQRIEAKRGFSFKLAHYARVLAMSAASLCMAAGLFEISSYGPAAQQLAANHYVDVLDDDNDDEALTYSHAVTTPDAVRPGEGSSK